MADSEQDVAGVLAQLVSKPPSLSLTKEEKHELQKFVTKNSTFRKLKGIVRITAWQKSVWLLNSDPVGENFQTNFAKDQGFRDGMLHALDLMESIVTEEGDDDDGE